MGFFKNSKKVEERSINPILIEMFKTNKMYISEKVVNKIPVVAECISKICGSIAQMPIYLYKEENFKIDRQYKDYREFLLNQEINEFETSYKFKYELVEDLLYYGKSYHFIERQGVHIKALHRIEPKTVTVKECINDNGIVIDKEIHYTLNNKSLVSNVLDFMIIEKGNGILNSYELLELMIQHNNTIKYALENSVLPLGVLQSKSRLSKEAIDRLRESWTKLYSGASNAGKTVILEEGLEYKAIDINIEQLQMIEQKEQFIADVQRLFNLYEVKCDDEFLKRTLAPLICCIENSIDKSLLLEKEKKQKFFYRFDTKELLRPSTKEQYEIGALAVQKGLMTVNEVRQYLDLPIFFNPKKDKLILSLGNCLADPNLNIDILNMGLTINSESKGVTNYKDE